MNQKSARRILRFFAAVVPALVACGDTGRHAPRARTHREPEGAAASVTAVAQSLPARGLPTLPPGPARIELPIGKEGVVHLETDLEPWGPSAAHVADDATFWILDGVASRVVHLSVDGTLLGSVAMPEGGAEALAVTSDRLYFLGSPMADDVDFVEASLDGKFLARTKCRGGTNHLVRVASKVYVSGDSGLYAPYDPVTHAIDYDKQLKLGSEAAPEIASPKLLAVLSDGSALLEQGDATGTAPPLTTLWRVAADGRPLGKTPFTYERQVYVSHPLAIRPDGIVYALEVTLKGAALVKLKLE